MSRRRTLKVQKGQVGGLCQTIRFHKGLKQKGSFSVVTYLRDITGEQPDRRAEGKGSAEIQGFIYG
jgi:hypothetical protein